MSVKIDKGNVAERTVDLFHISHCTRLIAEACKEMENMFMEFPTLVLWKINHLALDVPQEADECCNGHEDSVAFFFMPRDRKERSPPEYFSTVVVIAIFPIYERSIWRRELERTQVILILQYWVYSLCMPNVH